MVWHHNACLSPPATKPRHPERSLPNVRDGLWRTWGIDACRYAQPAEGDQAELMFGMCRETSLGEARLLACFRTICGISCVRCIRSARSPNPTRWRHVGRVPSARIYWRSGNGATAASHERGPTWSQHDSKLLAIIAAVLAGPGWGCGNARVAGVGGGLPQCALLRESLRSRSVHGARPCHREGVSVGD